MADENKEQVQDVGDKASRPNGENKLELHSMSRRERKRFKKEQYKEYTSDMTKSQKLRYFFDYYKWNIIIPVIVLIFVSYLGVTIYKNTRPVGLAYVILNAENKDAINTSFEEDYREYFELSDDSRFPSAFNMKIDFDYYLENAEYVQTSNSTDYNILSTQCEIGEYDVIITDEKGLKYCSYSKIIKPLKGYLDADAYKALSDYMYDSINPNGDYEPYAIDISDTEFAKGLNTGYDNIYLCFPGAEKQNKRNSFRLIEYIYGIKLAYE